jgi:DNA-binding response OmpR family regulator
MSKLIAVIDDSPTVRKILEIVFAREGYVVQSFHHPRELLRDEQCTKQLQPDFLFVDLLLPDMDGFEVIRQVRRANAQLPICVISRRDGLMNHLKAKLVGANEYAPKPFKVEEIVAAVRRHIPIGQH